MNTRQQPTWQEREAIRAWGTTDRTRIFKELVSRQPLYHSKCDQCHLHLNAAAVRCMTCKKHLCHKCDTGSHLTMPFHRRLLCSSDTLRILQPEQFIDPNGNIKIKDVCVPCFVPHMCYNAECEGSMLLIPHLQESIVVVNESGRFLVKAAAFVCDTCNSRTRATIDDYVFSGFFPGSLSPNVTYLFAEEALLLGHHITHKSPGSSKKMYAHSLEEVLTEYGRKENGKPVDIILTTKNKIDCPSCGKEPLVRSSDAILKLRRLESAGKVRYPENERTMEQPQARFGNLVIKSDTKVENFRQRIYNKIPTTKKKQMCGGSAFKAAREDSNEQKKYDETGLVVSSCKHCVVPYAINMFKGESWTHTAFMHNEAMKSNAKFFCYDVVCQYWKWMKKKVAGHFPEYSNLTSEMTGILPIMHKNAHQLPCKILWNPHWTTGIGLTGGEEHEQARKEIKQGTTKLEKLLETHNLVNNDLPLIHKELRKAKAILDQRKTKKTPVDTLRRMLEGLHAHLKTTSISISKEAENSKTRTKLRRVLTETKRKALETIELINSKDKTLPISYEDFNEGVFPWETVLDRDDTQFPTLSLADKYHILINARSSLQQSKHTGEDEEKFAKGKSVMAVSEVHHLNLKIQMALKIFNLKCNQDFSDFVCETQTNDYEPEFQFDTSDEDNYDSLSESEYSDEETESSSSYSENDESAI
uniref:CxC3 like cysteine cluster domain-containing protein n=1 Tax=Daphnia galeata TaxID=27404 RepID=A0A8J2RQL2_9CRUS|nr:unnamed protein product [Daphnia galeata]